MHPDADDGLPEKVLKAADALLHHDAYLLKYDLNERSITHHLAIHVMREFPGWDMDCGYNRNHDLKKQLRLPPRDDIHADDLNATTVFPDVIIHHRGTGDNLVVIEVKKSSNPEGDEWDLRKSEAFVVELGYCLGVFSRFQTGTAEPKYECRLLRHD